ncbi:MAG: hypothetical protein V4773_30050 [Verrucomicrobiota bacterium]
MAAKQETPFSRRPVTPADFQAWQVQLEQMGMPRDVARTVLAVMVYKEFERRRKELVGTPHPDEYWRSRMPLLDNPETTAALRQLTVDQKRAMREMGLDDFDADDDTERRMYGGLAPEKIARLKKIMSDYTDLEEQLYVDGRDRNSPETRARAELLAKEKRSDIERTLTPEELRDYDYRNSQAASRLRGQFGYFQATEAEFGALYPRMQAILETNGLLGPNRASNSAEARRNYDAATQQIEAALRETLGEARYAEMKDANDRSLRLTREFIASTNLPPQAASEVMAVQREFAPKLLAVDRNRDLNDNQRDAQAWALASEARERLVRTLGQENFEAYKRRGGSWLGEALGRKAPTPPPK